MGLKIKNLRNVSIIKKPTEKEIPCAEKEKKTHEAGKKIFYKKYGMRCRSRAGESLPKNETS